MLFFSQCFVLLFFFFTFALFDSGTVGGFGIFWIPARDLRIKQWTHTGAWKRKDGAVVRPQAGCLSEEENLRRRVNLVQGITIQVSVSESSGKNTSSQPEISLSQRAVTSSTELRRFNHYTALGQTNRGKFRLNLCLCVKGILRPRTFPMRWAYFYNLPVLNLVSLMFTQQLLRIFNYSFEHSIHHPVLRHVGEIKVARFTFLSANYAGLATQELEKVINS